MDERRKRIINTSETITFLILALAIGISIISDIKSGSELKSEKGMIIIGVIALFIGVFGFLKNEIQIGRLQRIEYEEGSKLGKAVNIIICIIGLILTVFGSTIIWGK